MDLRTIKDYRFICASIERCAKEIERRRQHVRETVQSAVDFPYWKHTVTVEGDIFDAGTDELRRELSELQAKKREVERFVKKIDDYAVKRAIEEKYISFAVEPVTWEATAELIGYPGSGNGLKVMVWRWIEKNLKNVKPL